MVIEKDLQQNLSTNTQPRGDLYSQIVNINLLHDFSYTQFHLCMPSSTTILYRAYSNCNISGGGGGGGGTT